jgi:hypothetical protein
MYCIFLPIAAIKYIQLFAITKPTTTNEMILTPDIHKAHSQLVQFSSTQSSIQLPYTYNRPTIAGQQPLLSNDCNSHTCNRRTVFSGGPWWEAIRENIYLTRVQFLKCQLLSWMAKIQSGIILLEKLDVSELTNGCCGWCIGTDWEPRRGVDVRRWKPLPQDL